MRICSLLPSATEVVAALGLAEELVGVSHECDYPPSVRGVPVMIRPSLDPEQSSSREIDRRVKAAVAAGEPLYRLDEDAFRLAQPDVVLTQDLCHVCAATPDHVARAAQALPSPPSIVSLDASGLEGVLADVEKIAENVGRAAEGRFLAQALRGRLANVSARTAGARRPRVVCLEWLDPLYVAGHWIPEMVQAAGGNDVLGIPQARSRETTWEEVSGSSPDIIILMPCGYTVDRTLQELDTIGPQRKGGRLFSSQTAWFVVDAASYFSRPGPRLIEGVELLGDLLHPVAGRSPDPGRAVKLDAAWVVGTSA